MIYTLTISPSIDFINIVDKFELDKINRTNKSTFLIGGKGINVSLVLKELNVESTVLGFYSDFTGQYLKKELDNKNIKNDLIEAKGYTRVNVKVYSDCETALNTDSLIIEQNHIDKLKAKLNALNEKDILIISGSISSGLKDDLYEQLIKDLKNVKVVIDCTKELLLKTLKYNPYLIKPNREELEEIFKIHVRDKDTAIDCAKILRKKGAQNVIVSLDKEGAILVDNNNNSYYLKSVDIKKVSSVGAGDSLVAGFICGIEKKLPIKEAFILGVACGNATAASKTLANKTGIDEMVSLIKEFNNENN